MEPNTLFFVRAAVAFVTLAAGTIVHVKKGRTGFPLFLIGIYANSFLVQRYENCRTVADAAAVSLPVCVLYLVFSITFMNVIKTVADKPSLSGADFIISSGTGVPDLLALFVALGVSMDTIFGYGGVVLLLCCILFRARFLNADRERAEQKRDAEKEQDSSLSGTNGNAYMFIPSVLSAYCVTTGIGLIVWAVSRALGR